MRSSLIDQSERDMLGKASVHASYTVSSLSLPLGANCAPYDTPSVESRRVDATRSCQPIHSLCDSLRTRDGWVARWGRWTQFSDSGPPHRVLGCDLGFGSSGNFAQTSPGAVEESVLADSSSDSRLLDVLSDTHTGKWIVSIRAGRRSLT